MAATTTTTTTPVRTPRELPGKESAIFKTVLKFYENRQYKKGLKAAETILKKYPNHGETLAMKGLFCSNLDRKEEAHDFIKKGIVSDMTSHVCWHVYGLFHRAERNYEEALKCYTHALRFDKENQQIMRDYSLLQIQMRNYESFNETRHQILNLRPSQRANWITLAVSYHLLKNYEMAEKIMSSYEESMNEENVGPLADFENSEMMLYKNMIIEESGDYTRALEHLDSIRGKVLQVREWREAKARILLKGEKLAEAQVEYTRLISENPDSLVYLEGYRKARGLGGDNADRAFIDRVLRMYRELGEKYPRSHVIQRLPLNFVSGDEFKAMASSYLIPLFQKGVPSLFVSLKDMISDPEKEQIIEQIVTEYRSSLNTNQTFFPTDEAKEPPTALLWVVYFLAQFQDYKGNTLGALELIDEAIKHSPTVVELYMTKARIYKHGGDPALAMATMNYARLLDLQDRCINSKCTKYMLANNALKDAEDTISLFTKSESADPLQDLVEMQCMWFALASGEAHLRIGNHGRALKRFHQIEKHFVEVYDDQFDFHGYALRKTTVRSYIDLLRMEDRIRSHPFFSKAAKIAVRTYIELFDGPLPTTMTKDGVDLSNLSESDRKKALRKARKAELKSQSEQNTPAVTKSDVVGAASTTAQASGTANTNANTNNKKKPIVDVDPDGKKFTVGVDLMSEAVKFLRPLQELSPSDMDGWVLGCQVYMRKKRYLKALSSLLHAHKLDATHPDVHRHTVKLQMEVIAELARPADKKELDPRVLGVLRSELATLFGVATSADAPLTLTQLKTFNKLFLDRHLESVPHRLAAAECVVLLDSGATSEALLILKGVGSEFKDGFTLETAIRVSTSLCSTFKDEVALAAFKAVASAAFPLSVSLK
ncbi:hypothetical protein BASA50_009605 [Batrachochytrium salamandrivorans]|uniref:Uncharacterized protein n=1 Tax=Batrachochytrium salamandrivorans TaxID=1357716 RepID=A0ABQ8F3P4_9FUNG|nr:hypothetical protein BASA61_006621 [Batrachochytrium salamandrivorans]KAH6590119.1 hypothetical protein BASA50_009605 [Batrachochytrium salamandrivorans]KAH9253406.1 hypothetical protein BASA81_008600 [Batrachochytrium salamandrivorans]